MSETPGSTGTPFVVPSATRATPRPSRRWRRLLTHSLRVCLLVAVIWLIHDAHQSHLATIQPASLTDVPVEIMHNLYGKHARIDVDRGTGRVVDEAGQSLGVILQTSPESDHLIGFSGPTNVLIAFGPNDRILGVRLLSSGDTIEHVEQIERDSNFLDAFVGYSRDDDDVNALAEVDAVSGATLTSLAIVESVLHRFGRSLTSLKFPQAPTPEQVRPLFPDAVRLLPDDEAGSWWDVVDDKGAPVGGLLRTSPSADNTIGYQGPTETFIGFDTGGVVVGIVVGNSYDNEPYVDYVRDDAWFRNSFNGRQLLELGALDLQEAGIEGVSGATMTSMAVAEGMILAAADFNTQHTSTARLDMAAPERSKSFTLSNRNWGTIGVLAGGLLIGATSLSGRRWVRIPFQCVLIGYLGFVNGDMLSQAVLVGWAKNGVPLQTMLGLFLLTVAAFLIPMTTKRNVYCHQLCPHGAAQQWLRPTKGRRVRIPRQLKRLLSFVPGGLLLMVVAVAMGRVSLSLVDIEPFDAYVISIAGTTTITIAVVGLIASAFVPMAYCRYGCPTGALIEYVRLHGLSDRFSKRDAVAAGCLILALFLRNSVP